ncbi:MAG: hypothetical protein GY738_04960 [Pseudoalteromonas sp.]|nr:hypothetical protein [Pseudoalteromonas sp.]
MPSEIKEAVEAAATHPKSSLVVTAAFTSNVWLDYGQPIIQALTSVVGLIVVSMLAVKHFLDLKNTLKNKDK